MLLYHFEVKYKVKIKQKLLNKADITAGTNVFGRIVFHCVSGEARRRKREIEWKEPRWVSWGDGDDEEDAKRTG